MWHSFLLHLPRLSRYTLGVKIDNLFTDILEITHTARYAKRENKLALLVELSKKFDGLKFFITLIWEAKALDAGKYGQLSRKLTRAGTMLGGWLDMLKNRAPAKEAGAV